MDILNVTRALKEALGFLKDGRRKKQEEFQSALRKLHTALNETRICLGRPQVTREDEENLSRLWLEAGIAFNRYDSDLTLRCELKADYWSKPSNWTEQDIDKMNIGLEAITKDIRALLTKPKK